MALESINPATGKTIQQFEELDDAGIEQTIAAADAAFGNWRETNFDARADCLRKAGNLLRERKDALGRLITTEMGKTLKDATAEVEKCGLVCDYYADNAEAFLAEEPIKTDAGASYVRFDPVGIVLAVMPWNFPFWQVFRFAAPALMAGNVGLLKHASNVQLCARAIEQLFSDAGFPHGTFANLAIGSGRVDAIIRDRRVKAVTLTGSEYAGSQVARTAGEVIKKSVLELGGSDPFIVLADADVDEAARIAVAARLQFNAGQSCISAKRFIVDRRIQEEFVERATAHLNDMVVGDPLHEDTTVGPLSSKQTLTDLEAQVNASIDKGAKLVCGGERIGDAGYFYTPAILTGVEPGMPVYEEEVFGPVMPIIGFDDIEEAIRIANSSDYGLAATVMSGDSDAAEALARRIESGSVFINGQVKSDPRLPFGGVKQSGYGRELAHYGIKEFVNIKTVWIK